MEITSASATSEFFSKLKVY